MAFMHPCGSFCSIWCHISPCQCPPPPPCPWYVISMWDCSSLHICQVVKKQCGAPFSTHNCPTPHLPCPHCVQTRALTTARGGRFQGFLGTPTLQQGGKSVFCVCEETCCAFIMFSFAPWDAHLLMCWEEGFLLQKQSKTACNKIICQFFASDLVY